MHKGTRRLYEVCRCTQAGCQHHKHYRAHAGSKANKENSYDIDFHTFRSSNSFLIPKALLLEQQVHDTTAHQTLSLQIRCFAIFFLADNKAFT